MKMKNNIGDYRRCEIINYKQIHWGFRVYDKGDIDEKK